MKFPPALYFKIIYYITFSFHDVLNVFNLHELFYFKKLLESILIEKVQGPRQIPARGP
jgi:hypothetical protein